jgi:hypothetical protein
VTRQNPADPAELDGDSPESAPTLTSGAVNDDEAGAHITVDGRESDDVTVFETHADGTRTVLHDGSRKGSR